MDLGSTIRITERTLLDIHSTLGNKLNSRLVDFLFFFFPEIIENRLGFIIQFRWQDASFQTKQESNDRLAAI